MTRRVAPGLSVVVPLFDEEANVRLLVEGIRRALGEGDDWELILVDDGSRDRTAEVAAGEAAGDPRIRLLRLARNYGQTPAMQAGFDHARGRVVVSMDGDLQNEPMDIPRLVATLEEGYDLVAGYRERRQDAFWTRKVPSWIANRIIRLVTGVSIRDNGCSLKAYRRELLDRLHLYSDLHRFIPAVAAATAGARITEIPVRHHPRRFGRSKYGLSRTGKVLVDLLTVVMIRSFRRRPLVLFSAGAVVALTGATGFAALGAIALLGLRPGMANAFVFPSAALICFALACNLATLGLIAEVAVRNRERGEEALPPLTREVPTT